jgi:hypothetical protein
MLLVVSSLCGIHVPSRDHPDLAATLLPEDQDEEAARLGWAKYRVVPPLCLAEQRRNGEHLLSFFRLYPMAEREMQNIAIIPLES